MKASILRDPQPPLVHGVAVMLVSYDEHGGKVTDFAIMGDIDAAIRLAQAINAQESGE